MSDRVDTRVRLDPDRHRQLELLVKDTGWSANQVLNRSIADMFALHYVARAQAEQAGGASGALLIRVNHEFGAGRLVNRKLAFGEDQETGAPLISATDEVTGEVSLFYEDPRGRLLVQRTLDGVVEHYLVKAGELRLLDNYPTNGSPHLN